MSKKKDEQQKKIIRRGDLWWANLNPEKGREPGKLRPVFVIQSDFLNDISHPTCTIIPISSQIQEENVLRHPIKNKGLEKESFILVDQIRTLDIEKRMIKYLGSLSSQDIKKIEEKIKIFLDLY